MYKEAWNLHKRKTPNSSNRWKKKRECFYCSPTPEQILSLNSPAKTYQAWLKCGDTGVWMLGWAHSAGWEGLVTLCMWLLLAIKITHRLAASKRATDWATMPFGSKVVSLLLLLAACTLVSMSKPPNGTPCERVDGSSCVCKLPSHGHHERVINLTSLSLSNGAAMYVLLECFTVMKW